MPRGRPKKQCLTRMDAAVDAMARLGFPEEKARRHVNKLLTEYGGNEGWPFIEDHAYTELIEAILREEKENAQHKVVEDGNQLQEKSFEDERDVGTSSRALDTQQDERPEDNIAAVAEPACSEVICSPSEIHNGDEKGRKDIIQDQAAGQIEVTTIVGSKNGDDPTTELHTSSTSLKNTPTPQPTNGLPTASRIPCYGWIESDEEDVDDFIFSKPASLVIEDKATLPQEPSKSERQRKSRWDPRPDEPLRGDLFKEDRKCRLRWDQRPETLPWQLSKPERKRRSRWDQKPDDP